ncbi:kinase-like domain-containing protein [Dactylonectria macrodidyma]|uniref:Kinase-like domain-containing protein n=1 Tax=Dactylonectria macrodidyma TaxID=307937 RepID=A0A9P9JGZ9_9HYPO|nr:kinase-like domain-containing protein [Dactylonectria macrodidyma]
MPLRDGSLRSLIKASAQSWTSNESDELTLMVLEHMLSALDYLACNNMCHGDMKPENILYWKDKGGITFQLADFGLANHCQKAVTKCGTDVYEAPELHIQSGENTQSPKMDVWSLFATIADINPRFTFPPRETRIYATVLEAIRTAALVEPSLAPMVRENPNHRASAAQLLLAHFEGRGLSTPKGHILPIANAPPASVAPKLAPATNTPTKARAKAPVALPVVKYPRQPLRLRLEANRTASPMLRPVAAIITKRRAPSPLAPLGQRRARVHTAKQPPPDNVPAKENGPKDREESLQPDTMLLDTSGSFPA